jgi:hypothetical protein
MKILGSGALGAQERLEGLKNSGWISSKLMNILTFTVVCKHSFFRCEAALTGVTGAGQGNTNAARFCFKPALSGA